MRLGLPIKILILTTSTLLIAACAHKNPQPETIRICDDSGCADRPKDFVSFDAAKALGGDSEQKITALESLAKQDPRAAYDLALRFFRGDGVKQDSYRSIKWMRDAAERGHLEAQKALGRLYLTGLQEMGADPGEAEKWLSITASRGDREASKLLKEAAAARQYTQAEYRWRTRWQPLFYDAWNAGYHYNWYWGNNGWALY